MVPSIKKIPLQLPAHSFLNLREQQGPKSTRYQGNHMNLSCVVATTLVQQNWTEKRLLSHTGTMCMIDRNPNV